MQQYVESSEGIQRYLAAEAADGTLATGSDDADFVRIGCIHVKLCNDTPMRVSPRLYVLSSLKQSTQGRMTR